MNALVIGQGGREHALVRALSNAPSIRSVHAVPGSAGMAKEATCHGVDWRETPALLELVRKEAIDFVVIGPEGPLVEGLSDRLREAGISVVAPSRAAAHLEGSKIFCKEFLVAAGVPTARSVTVSSVAETRAAMLSFPTPYVLKADGLAAGKGVFICTTQDELLAAAHDLFEKRIFGDAGALALLEEFQPGYEISYLVLTNGQSYQSLPLAQDHKRLLDDDRGPNTGGMGVVAPVKIDSTLQSRIEREVLAPTMDEFQKRGFLYRGVLFIGLMITAKGPSVLEFNTRFGDPETQAILPLLDGDWGTVFRDLGRGELQRLDWRPKSSCCIVIAAEGYPDKPVTGTSIDGLPSPTAERYVLHAGTRRCGDQWQAAGGRVLNAVAIADDLRQAVNSAYEAARAVKMKGSQMRGDIGAKILGN